MVTLINKLYAEHVRADVARGREAVIAEVKQADLPWAKRVTLNYGQSTSTNGY